MQDSEDTEKYYARVDSIINSAVQWIKSIGGDSTQLEDLDDI